VVWWLKFADEKPALEGIFEAENVTKNSVFGHISPADLPRNEGQIRPLIEKLDHNGERLKVWADVVASGEKPTQRLCGAVGLPSLAWWWSVFPFQASRDCVRNSGGVNLSFQEFP
jgi:hypothetical protein